MPAYVLDALRTPFGRFGGALATERPDDLLAHAIRTLVERTGIDPGIVDDVVAGNANGAGEENRNVARMAWLLAGLPDAVPGATVNRLCGSSLEAVIQAHRAIGMGEARAIVACGVESMTRAPWVMAKPDRAFPAGDGRLHSTTLGWRLVNPAMPAEYTLAMGEGAEVLAEEFGIGREEQDAFALRSHRLAHEAWEAGRYAQEVVPVGGLDRDEGIRPDTSLEQLARLRPAFRADGGTVTAGNASQLSDGAAAVLVGDESLAEQVEPLARIVSVASHAMHPRYYGIGPVEAANRALRRAGWTWDQVNLVELNEAFAAQSLACLRGWPELDPGKVNVDGGAIALGHPLGASGARVVGHLARALRDRGLRRGVAAICIGVGQGLAVTLER